jgi:hypothetical protein
MKGETTETGQADHGDEPSLAGFLTGRGSLPYNRIVGGDPVAHSNGKFKEFNVLCSIVIALLYQYTNRQEAAG